jgi:hypothetical protein
MKQIRGVADVTPKLVDDADWMARVQVKKELAERLLKLYHDCLGVQQ